MKIGSIGSTWRLAGALGLVLLIALIVALMVPALAQPPSTAHTFWGNVTTGGNPALEETAISAQIGEVEYGSGAVDASGGYGWELP
ncbi:MAG: hypothetical protein KAS54_08350, partial [Dehalococcoidia bacterium]|nr:hypothetical protein [Dehalococcoidia bacterium]